MSTYGRLWEDVANIRKRLRQLLQADVALNSKDTETRVARLTLLAESTTGEARDLLLRWVQLETAMAQCDGRTGEPQ